MASLHQLLSAVQGQVKLVTTGLNMFNSAIDVQSGIGWPSVRTLQTITKMTPPTVLITVYDRKSAHDSTRWIPSVSVLTQNPTGLVSSPARQILPGGGTATISVSGATLAGDAISLVLQNRDITVLAPGDNTTEYTPSGAVVYSPPVTDPLPNVVIGLAAVVNADPILSQWVVASSTDPAIVLASRLSTHMVVQSYTGNNGSRLLEIARRKRELQLTVWAPTPEIRDIVSDPIEDMIAEIETFRGHQNEYTGGLALQDGTFARIHSTNDYLVDAAVLSDMYRRDFMFSADYGITSMDQLYSVLAPVTTYVAGYPPPVAHC